MAAHSSPLNPVCLEGALLATRSPSSRRHENPVHARSFRRRHRISNSEHPLGGALLLPWSQSRGLFYPGLNLGVDFRGGVVVELRGPQALQVDTIREAFAPLGFGDLRVQEFGSPQDVLVRFENKANLQDAQRMIASRVAEALPGVQIRRTEVVGARVSGELFRNGLLATGLALVAVLVYIWFRFEWQFGVGVVATLILDITKTVGFFAVTQIEFDLNSVAALLTLIGYSVTDKVVVDYDQTS